MQQVTGPKQVLRNDPTTASDNTIQKINDRLFAAYTMAELILKDNEDCATLLGQGRTAGGASFNAAQLLSSLYNGGQYGSISIGDLDSPHGTTVSAQVQPGVVANAQGVVQNGAAYMTINDLAGSFVTGTPQSQVVTLLHELGHAMNDVFGAGTSLIRDDGQGVHNGTQISMDNSALVQQTCWPPPAQIIP